MEWTYARSLLREQLDLFPTEVDIAKFCQTIIDVHCRLDGFLSEFNLHVMLTDDAGMTQINLHTRGLDQTTDVLSFPLLPFTSGVGSSCLRKQYVQDSSNCRDLSNINQQEIQHPSVVELLDWQAADMLKPMPGSLMDLGEIVISAPVCIAQAKQIGHSIDDEFKRLLVHGILHLFGYDHVTSEMDRLRMEAREDALLML